jgi:hypothetical protein
LKQIAVEVKHEFSVWLIEKAAELGVHLRRGEEFPGPARAYP